VHLGAAIAFGVTRLPAVTFHLDGGDAEDSDLGEGGFDGVELLGLDDGFDHLHRKDSWKMDAVSLHRKPSPGHASVLNNARASWREGASDCGSFTYDRGGLSTGVAPLL